MLPAWLRLVLTRKIGLRALDPSDAADGRANHMKAAHPRSYSLLVSGIKYVLDLIPAAIIIPDKPTY